MLSCTDACRARTRLLAGVRARRVGFSASLVLCFVYLLQCAMTTFVSCPLKPFTPLLTHSVPYKHNRRSPRTHVSSQCRPTPKHIFLRVVLSMLSFRCPRVLCRREVVARCRRPWCRRPCPGLCEGEVGFYRDGCCPVGGALLCCLCWRFERISGPLVSSQLSYTSRYLFGFGMMYL